MMVQLSTGYIVICAGIVVMCSALWMLMRRKKVNTDQLLDSFRSTSFASEDELCWYVSHDVIGAAGYEDCVIYQVDKSEKVCRQIAAYGPKNPDKKSILNPILISFERGIVGAVAVSGKAEIIIDTTRDPRYVPDDDVRYSELTVPVSFNGAIRFIIDSEHKRRNRYKEADLEFFIAVASIMSEKAKSLSA
jgi:two-component system, LytTR family, sensor kinase